MLKPSVPCINSFSIRNINGLCPTVFDFVFEIEDVAPYIQDRTAHLVFPDWLPRHGQSNETVNNSSFSFVAF